VMRTPVLLWLLPISGAAQTYVATELGKPCQPRCRHVAGRPLGMCRRILAHAVGKPDVQRCSQEYEQGYEMITLRFVTGSDLLSRLIRMQAGISMPFTPSHVEAFSPDGKFYIGAHFNGGVAARPTGYDRDQLMTLPDGSRSERLINLPATAMRNTRHPRFCAIEAW
jgi:hypothetical protein